MSYYNRLELLKYTLRSISQSSVDKKDYEIVIVDDFSNNENSLDSIRNFNGMNIKIIKMSDRVNEKNYSNPCIPFNVAFKESIGDIVIIQNPECCHAGDVLNFCSKNSTHDSYLTFCCYSLNKNDTEYLHKNGNFNLVNRSVTSDGDSGWYNHHIYRPVGYHFTSCITRKNLNRLNGFDEKYARGHGYDDNEFLYRINLMKLNIRFIDNPFVVHQFHYSGSTDTSKISQDNSKLFSEYTQKRNIIEANKD